MDFSKASQIIKRKFKMKMKYPKNYLDEIKLRLKVSQIVGKNCKIKRRGKEFIGLSPFTQKKLHLLQLVMKKVFITALVLVNMEIYLIF